MEEQTNLETVEIGTKESIKLKPENVKIVKATVEQISDRAKKVVCECKHPDVEDTIKISSARIEKNGKLEVSGLWFNTDETKEERKEGKIGQIQKGSALAMFLNFMQVGNVKQLEEKECVTVEDDNGYLVFKAY